MDGVGIAPATLTKLMQRFPQLIGLKEASHNWEKFLELGRAARSRCAQISACSSAPNG